MEPQKLFIARPPESGPVPLLIGLQGPPGGGKTVSAHRLAAGMKRVRKGPVVGIDTEAGRMKKLKADFDFLWVDFPPPFKPGRFWQAIEDQLDLNPSAIIVDSLSDEHEGEGGVLEWHDELVAAKSFGDNSQYAWGPPKAERKRLIGRMLRVKVSLIFTFRAREKTSQEDDTRRGREGKKRVVSLGWMPVAPLEIVHALDLNCLLPSRSNGVPEWKSDKAGTDFVLKLPDALQPHVRKGQITEETGEALARWAGGGWAEQGKTLGIVSEDDRKALLAEVQQLLTSKWPSGSRDDKAARGQAIVWAFKVEPGNGWKQVEGLPLHRVRDGLDALQRMLEGHPKAMPLDDAEFDAAAAAEEERAAIVAAG